MTLSSVRARDGEILIPLHDGELALLINASEGRILPLRFGTGGVALIAAQAAWSCVLLAQWRGTAFYAGAGI